MNNTDFCLINKAKKLIFGMSRTKPNKNVKRVYHPRFQDYTCSFDGIVLVNVKNENVEFVFYRSNASRSHERRVEFNMENLAFDTLHGKLDKSLYLEKAKQCFDRLHKFGFLKNNGSYIIYQDSCEELNEIDLEEIDDEIYIPPKENKKPIYIILELRTIVKNSCVPTIFSEDISYKTSLCNGVQVCCKPTIKLNTMKKKKGTYYFLRMTICRLVEDFEKFKEMNDSCSFAMFTFPKPPNVKMKNVVYSLKTIPQNKTLKKEKEKKKTLLTSSSSLSIKPLKEYLPQNLEWKIVNPINSKLQLALSATNPTPPDQRVVLNDKGLRNSDYDTVCVIDHHRKDNNVDFYFYAVKDYHLLDELDEDRERIVNKQYYLEKAELFMERLQKFQLFNDERPILIQGGSQGGVDLTVEQALGLRVAQYHQDAGLPGNRFNGRHMRKPDYIILEMIDTEECVSTQFHNLRTKEELRTAICSGYQICVDNETFKHRSPYTDLTRKRYTIGNQYITTQKPRTYFRTFIFYTSMDVLKDSKEKVHYNNQDICKITLPKKKNGNELETFDSIQDLLHTGTVHLIGGA